MRTDTALKIGAGAAAAGGLIVALIAILLPRIVLFPVGAVLVAVGSIGFRLIGYRSFRRTAPVQPGWQYFRRSLSFGDDNAVARFMNHRPWLLVAWFLLVAAVAFTVGVIAETHRRDNPRNGVGGIIFMVFGVVALALAFAVLTHRRKRRR